MTGAREFLAAVQERVDKPHVLWPAMAPERAFDLTAALRDRRRLVAALTAVLDLADETLPGYIAGNLSAVIEGALTNGDDE